MSFAYKGLNQKSLLTAIAIASIGIVISFVFALPTHASSSVSGRVEKADGTPVTGGVRVQVNAEFPCTGPSDCGGGADITASDGSFAVSSGIGTGQYRVEVMVNDPAITDAAPDPIKINLSGSAVDVGTLKLVTANIQGVVKGPSGESLVVDFGAGQNINVQIHSKDYTINKNISVNSTGNFKTALGVGDYVVNAQPMGFPSYTDGEAIVNVANTSTVQNVTVNLSSPQIIGQVKDANGGTLSLSIGQFINVQLYNQDRTVSKFSNSDTSGNFRFGSLPNGTYTIEAQPMGLNNYTNGKASITYSGSPLTGVEVRLSTPQLKGSVQKTASDSTPVPYAGINVHNQDWSDQTWTSADSKGNYAVGGLDPAKGPHYVDVNVPWGTTGLVSKTFTVTITAGTQSLNLYYDAATKKITGKVTRASGGAGVAGAQVNANREGGMGYANATTGADGSYTLEVGGGSWTVNVWPNNQPGQPPADWVPNGFGQRVEFNNDSTSQTTTVNFSVLTATATVKGKLVRADGTPITNANVDVRNDSGQGNNSMVDPSGNFSVKVSAGTYRVNVWTSDQGVMFPETNISIAENETKDLGLIKANSKDARIIGKVVKQGTETGVSGVRVNAFLDRAPGWSNSTTDSSGNFELAVTRGLWHVNIDQGSNTSYVYAGHPIDVAVETDTSRVTLSTNIELVFADVTIKGKVVDQDGKVVPNFCGYAFARPASTSTFGPGSEYGAPVNCQTSSFEIKVPSKVASTYSLGVHTPPNADYTSGGAQNVAVLADQTYEKNIVLKKNDASIVGKLVDQNGNALTQCSFRGDVFVNTETIWRNAQIQPNCTYTISLLGGVSYRLGYWIEESQGILPQPPSDEKIEVPAGATVSRDITVRKADATIKGQVLDPNGNAAGNLFVFASNFPEFNREGPPEPEDFAKMINSGGKVNPDGTFSLPVLSGHTYEVNVHLQPGSTFLPPDFTRVKVTESGALETAGGKMVATGSSIPSLTLQLKKALGTLSGIISVSGRPVQFAYVHCWREEGGFNGTPVEFGGNYSLNYSAGTWHCGADSFDGTTFYRSDEVTLNITTQTSLTQNFELKQSKFTVPPAVSKTFDATATTVITLENGTTINIPSGALASSGNVTVRATPTVDLIHTKGEQPFGVGYELEAQDESGNTISTFNSNVTITFSYTDEQLEDLGLTEESLVSKYYDEQTGTWKDPNGIAVDNDTNTITISTNHFTKFAVVATGSGSNAKAKSILAMPNENGGPQLSLWSSDGKLIKSFFVFPKTFRGTVNARSGDLDGDGTDEIVAVPGSGGGPHLRIFDKNGNLLAQTFVYNSGFRGGVLLELADVDGDGAKEIVVAVKSAGGPQVRIFKYAAGTITLHSQFMAFASGFRGGLFLSVGDVDGDGDDDIVVTPRKDGGPQVRIFDGSGKLLSQFMVGAASDRKGVDTYVADVDSDGKADIITVSQPGQAPDIQVWSALGVRITRFMAYQEGFYGGVQVSVGDVDGDGANEIVVTPRKGGGPHVRVFSARGQLEASFFAYAKTFRGGLRVQVADLDADGTAEIITAPEGSGGPNVSIFSKSGTAHARFMSHHPAFRGGVNLSIGTK